MAARRNASIVSLGVGVLLLRDLLVVLSELVEKLCILTLRTAIPLRVCDLVPNALLDRVNSVLIASLLTCGI